MKIPVHTPSEQLRDALTTIQHVVRQSISDFRANILSNRDVKYDQRQQRVSGELHEVSIVPYEATPKAVDADSFAYALTAEMTENQAENLQKPSHRPLLQSLLQHPARVLAGIVIVILLVYTAIMFGQANNNQGSHISSANTKHQSN